MPVCPIWLSHEAGVCQDRIEGEKVLPLIPALLPRDPQLTQILRQKAETLWQTPTGGITSVWSFIMSGSPGTDSSYKVLKMQTGFIPLQKNIREQCWQYFPLSQSPACHLAGSILYSGGFQLGIKNQGLN